MTSHLWLPAFIMCALHLVEDADDFFEGIEVIRIAHFRLVQDDAQTAHVSSIRTDLNIACLLSC